MLANLLERSSNDVIELFWELELPVRPGGSFKACGSLGEHAVRGVQTVGGLDIIYYSKLLYASQITSHSKHEHAGYSLTNIQRQGHSQEKR